MKNIIVYIVAFIIVFVSLGLPEILLKIEDKNIEIEVYDKNKNANKIDVEAEKIYLVKAIHEMEEGKTIEISSPQNQYFIVEKQFDATDGFMKNINEQIIKLQEYEIIKDIVINENSKCKLGLIKKDYQNNQNSYTVNHVMLDFDNSEYLIKVESKTGKILYIALDKNKIWNKDNPKQILENYIKYLNLYIIDDWKYEIDGDNKAFSMKSEKAAINVKLSETEESYMLSIHISSSNS